MACNNAWLSMACTGFHQASVKHARMVCENFSPPANQNEGRRRQVPRLPCKPAANGPQARHQIHPSAIRATPATRTESRWQAWHLATSTFVLCGRRGSCSQIFSSSRLADVALRLGPYMSISYQKDICTRTQLVHKSRQIRINQKTTQGQQPRRPANPPSQFCVSSKENSKPDKDGARPKQTTTTKRMCQRTQRIYHCATPQKLAK